MLCCLIPSNQGEATVSTCTNWRVLEQQILKVIKTGARPVAVAFLDAEPAGVKRFEGTQPSGCSFWRLAAEGRTFYTIPENHFNCAVGAYTHNIPRLAKAPKAIVYSPLADTPVDPDVALFALRPAAAMLLQEAAGRAGVGIGAPSLGRPTCMALPASVQLGAIVSLGCIGNRVYTGLGEDELYVVLRARDLARVAEELHVISGANAALRDYARGRREQLSSR